MFTVKQLFNDLTRSEILFLNKGLRILTEMYGLEVKKGFIPGEKYPSNFWPDKLEADAGSMFRSLRGGADKKEILDVLKCMKCERKIHEDC